MYKYKTKDGSDRVFIGIGETVNGVIESETAIESPNLELVEEATTPAAQPQGGVIGVAPSQPGAAVTQATPVTPEKPTNEEQK